MGPDTVEFMPEIEDVFGVTIPDEDAARLGILGDLAAYIADKRSSDVLYAGEL
jgi:acyl carrier protein